jgi:hypothetical protein
MRVIRGQASSGNQIRETRHEPASEPTRRHQPDQPGMLMQPWNPAADQAPELPYMNRHYRLERRTAILFS